MHFHAALILIEARFVEKLLSMKSRVKFSVDARQQIEIKGRCNAQRIVVSHLQLWPRLFQIGSQQKRISRLKDFTHATQKRLSCLPIEVPNRAAKKQHESAIHQSVDAPLLPGAHPDTRVQTPQC